MRINNNMSAVVTNNQLLGTEQSLADVMEKLSSGFNINHASDNPSGIAIAAKMQAQIDGLDQASRNGSDGISVLQTAEGALQEVTDMIQRIRELSVQAANGTNAQGERETIQKEINSLRSEIDRISESTQFNSLNLLDGSLDNRTYANHCTRVQTSETVPAGPYELTITHAATPAIVSTSQTYTGSFVAMIDKQEGTSEDGLRTKGLQHGGTVTINGVTAILAEGMSGENVYEAIRQAAEIGGAVLSDRSEKLSISTTKYGSHANLKISFSSDELASDLGFTRTDLNLSSDRVSKYVDSLSNYVNDQSYVTETGATLKGLSHGGNVTINGITINFEQGMKVYTDKEIEDDDALGENDPDYKDYRHTDVYLRLKEAADKSQSTEHPFRIVSGRNEPLKISDVSAIQFSDRNMAEALGLDYDNDEAVSVTKVGTNPVVELTRETDESQFSSQATVAYDGNRIIVSDTNGFEISLLADVGYQRTPDNADPGTVQYDGKINIDVTEIGSLTLQIGANKGQTMDVRIGNISTKYMYIDGVDVTKTGGPEDAMDKLDAALTYVTGIRSQIGAYENRLEHTTKSLDATSENMTSAISRIEDVDMATTMVEYTRLNVLEQAATSALAQANELPQLALQLLQK